MRLDRAVEPELSFERSRQFLFETSDGRSSDACMQDVFFLFESDKEISMNGNSNIHNH